MEFSTDGKNILFQGVNLSESQSNASGKLAQQIAEAILPGGYDPFDEDLNLAEVVEGLKEQLTDLDVNRDMLTTVVGYMGGASSKHKRSPGVNLMHIHTAMEVLRMTRDQMFPEND